MRSSCLNANHDKWIHPNSVKNSQRNSGAMLFLSPRLFMFSDSARSHLIYDNRSNFYIYLDAWSNFIDSLFSHILFVLSSSNSILPISRFSTFLLDFSAFISWRVVLIIVTLNHRWHMWDRHIEFISDSLNWRRTRPNSFVPSRFETVQKTKIMPREDCRA